MTSRDQFEQAYADYTLCRQGDSYSLRKLSTAWQWWERGKEAA